MSTSFDVSVIRLTSTLDLRWPETLRESYLPILLLYRNKLLNVTPYVRPLVFSDRIFIGMFMQVREHLCQVCCES